MLGARRRVIRTSAHIGGVIFYVLSGSRRIRGLSESRRAQRDRFLALDIRIVLADLLREELVLSCERSDVDKEDPAGVTIDPACRDA